MGERRSGKFSLINIATKVDIMAAPGTATGKADINHGIHPKASHHLIVHEYPGFEPSDVQGLQDIQGTISYWTEPTRSAAEELHAIRICVPTSDAISGGIGEGVEEI